MAPEDWPEPVLAPFKDVISDPAAWAKKCVEVYGAGAIVIQLKSVDINDKDASPESAAETAGRLRQRVAASFSLKAMVDGILAAYGEALATIQGEGRR